MELKTRCKNMMSVLGIPVTRFCQNINISTHSYYKWQNNEIELSDKRLMSIQAYLEKYNF